MLLTILAHNLNTLRGSAPPLPVLAGGGGFHKGKKRRKRHKHVDEILSDIEKIYADLQDTPQRQTAGEIVRPYAATDAKVPQPVSVDWVALERDAQKVAALMALWHQHQIDMDDEDIFLLGG